MMLLTAGTLSAAMGLYHFFLPSQFEWARYVEGLPPIIRWALFSINSFFSFLLLVAGLLVILVAWQRAHAQPIGLWVIAGSAAFWAFNFAYLLIWPMPLPARLALVGIGLRSYSLVAMLLHAVPLGLLLRANRNASFSQMAPSLDDPRRGSDI
jgi:hypothetical protein